MDRVFVTVNGNNFHFFQANYINLIISQTDILLEKQTVISRGRIAHSASVWDGVLPRR